MDNQQPLVDLELKAPGVNGKDNGSNGVTPQKLNAAIPGINAKGKQPFDGETTGDVLFNLQREQIPLLLDPFLPQVGISCLAGSSDTGKSMLMRQAAIKIVTGQTSFLDYQLSTRHQSAIYLATEDNDRNTSFLLRRQAWQHTANELRGLRFIFDPDAPLKTLAKSLKNRPADLVVVDTFGDVFTDTLNDSQHVRAFLNPYQQLANEHECQILFLHHTGKRTEDFAPNKSNLLGSQGFEAKMRLVMELRRDHVEPNKRHLCVVKGNYLPSDVKTQSYVLDFDSEHFTFSNSGDRVPFEMLAKQQTEDPLKTKWQRCESLMSQGLKGDDLAKELGYSNRGGVSKLIKKATENGWIIGEAPTVE